MAKKIEMTEEQAEQIIQPIIDWLASGAHGTDIEEKYCFGTVSQDLAMSFAQELLESVGIDPRMMTGLAHKLTSSNNATLAHKNNIDKTIH